MLFFQLCDIIIKIEFIKVYIYGESCMRAIIGIDVGGSTTKIVGFRDADNMNEETLISPLFVRAADPLTSLYGAFGKFTDENGLSLSDIECVMLTGVGSTFIEKGIYSLPCMRAGEFNCIGLGGLYLSGLERAVVASLGTGTALVYSESGHEPQYLGGTGVGGGTLIGLSKKLLGTDRIEDIEALACEGRIENVDLFVGDMTRKNLDGVSSRLTAANFGNISGFATNGDLALGLFNMVYETVAMMAIFAARSFDVKDIVLTGNLTMAAPASGIFRELSDYFKMNFIIPEHSRFATVIGAALSYKECCRG